MINGFIRENKIASIVLTVIRLFLGYSWFKSGFGKLAGGGFDASGFLTNAIENPVSGPDGAVYGWYTSFIEGFALPNVRLFNMLIPLGELLVGLGLILGCLTTAAALFGVVMNFSFLLAGTISHNPTDILMGLVIMFAGMNAGYYGLDRWVLPFLRKNILKNDQEKPLSHS